LRPPATERGCLPRAEPPRGVGPSRSDAGSACLRGGPGSPHRRPAHTRRSGHRASRPGKPAAVRSQPRPTQGRHLRAPARGRGPRARRSAARS